VLGVGLAPGAAPTGAKRIGQCKFPCIETHINASDRRILLGEPAFPAVGFTLENVLEKPPTADLQPHKAQRRGSRKWTTEVNGWDSEPIRVAGCLSPEYFARETEHIFRKSWLPVGREQELSAPGAFLVKNFDAPKSSVLVIRGKDNRLRGFHNVCSHRCNRISREERGTCSTLYCRYHGWLYDTSGKLLHVPDEGEFYDLRKEDLGLAPVALETWNGFIFINLDPSPQERLSETLAELYEGLDGYPFEEMSHCVAWRARVNANWKLLKDAFCEVYHLPFAHRQSAGHAYTSTEAPVPHALSIRVYKSGGQYTFGGNLNATYPPASELSLKIISKTTLNARRALADPRRKPTLFNPTGAENWFGEVVQLYPSLQLSIYPTYFYYHNFIPISHDATMWELRRYTRPPKSFAERFSHEHLVAQLKATVLEDVQIVEEIYAAMNTGAKEYFHLSDQELLVRENHVLTQRKAGPYPTN
jgi:Rieske 2Fe-2S family protein